MSHLTLSIPDSRSFAVDLLGSADSDDPAKSSLVNVLKSESKKWKRSSSHQSKSSKSGGDRGSRSDPLLLRWVLRLLQPAAVALLVWECDG